ncbi:MAG: hypothetical protein GEU80_12520 [Dehalococcoidia bacterium]|nr:hypothetical protein [Dehalococcoidia bacterium]
MLANVYLHRLDRAWGTRGQGVLVRYADDIVVMCVSEQEAVRALEALTALLGELGLEPKLEKTRIVHLKEGGEGFDFLGFHHRWVRAQRARHVQFLMRSPSRRAMQHVRDRLRELTARSRLLVSVEQVVQELNRFLRGWAGYFRYGNSARHFRTVEAYASMRLQLFVSKRRRWARRHLGRGVHGFADRLGLLTLDGWVVAPRPNRPWRAPPNTVR